MSSWHAGGDVLARFAREPEALDDVTASSVEQHLVACGDCRAVVAATADPALVRTTWAAIVDTIDVPRPTLVERGLRTVGVAPHHARVVAATPGLRLAWLVTVALLAVGASAAERSSGAESFLLVVAPLLPLAAVLLMFLPAEEPAGEVAIATPMHGFALVVTRALAVLAPTMAVLLAAGAALPELRAGGALWVLPGLALAVATLALASFVRASVAATTVATGWLLALALASAVDGRGVPLADTAVFGPTGQALAGTSVVVAAVCVYLRRDRYSTLEVSW